MKPITKDSKISVDVRDCTPKQRGLVLDRFISLTDDQEWKYEWKLKAKNEAEFINLNYSNRVSYSFVEYLCNPEVISFKQFLKRANPYAGKEYTITFDTPKQHKKAQKRLFKMGYAWYDTGVAIAEYGSNPITIDDDMDMAHQSTGSITITYSQFMNMELPEEEKPLMFEGYKVLDRGDEFKVGCKRFSKEGVKNLMLLINVLKEESIAPEKAIEWLIENERQLNL